MCEPNNGHAPTTSADKYTGTIILRTRPHTYKRVVRLLSEGVPAIRIARDCKVTERSVAAIAKREREEITERKKSLACLMSNIAGRVAQIGLTGKKKVPKLGEMC
jgi:hypothetical protein